MPAGYAAPCPVFAVSPVSVSQSGTLALSATPQAGTDYIYTTAYYTQGSTWLPVQLSGNNAAPSYSSGPASGSLSPNILSQLTPGTNYIVLWDWLWDATAQCYKGPGLNQCNTGTWRVQTFGLTQATSGPQVSISPTSLTFPATQVGVTSAVQTVTLTNVGTANLTISTAFVDAGDFRSSGTCAVTSYAPGTGCSINITFTPTAAGTRTGSVTLADNAANSPQTISLTGSGSSGYTYSQSAYTTGCSNCNHFYVSTTGSDSNNGSQASPWKTITHADAALALGSGGTIVHVAPGTYSPSTGNCSGNSSYVCTNSNGTASQKITYISDTKWGAKIITTGSKTVSCWGNWGNYVEINGFDIGGNGTPGSANCAAGILTYGTNDRIIGNHVHDIAGACETGDVSSGGAGIAYSHGDTTTMLNGLIDSNVVHNTGNSLTCGGLGGAGTHGIYPSRAGITVTNNIVYRNSDYGIHMYHAVDKGIIANNLSFNNVNAGILIGTDHSQTVDHITVINNISRDSTVRGECIREFSFSGPTNNFISNNICFNNIGGTYTLASGDVAHNQIGSVQESERLID